MADEPGNPDAQAPTPHRRRPRYAGTHPRRFEHRYKELSPEKYPEMVPHIRAQGRTPAGTHVPIMVAEVLAALDPRPGDIVCDCTVGYGGHAAEFLKRVGPGGRLVGFDVDEGELARTRERLAALGVPISLHRGNFAGIGNVLASEGIDGYDVVFADLGVSSMQIDDPTRGFSYKHDGPLDMRMDGRTRHTAADVLASATQEELSVALLELADEEDHAAIARAIARRRADRPITRTLDLVEIILAAKGTTLDKWKKQRRAADRSRDTAGESSGGDDDDESVGGESGEAVAGAEISRLHPAAKTFQALRILVNDELGSLAQLLRAAPYCLRPGGRIAILTFHSGEDRLVKKSFAQHQAAGLFAEISPDPIRPTGTEIHDNPRATAAKLRWARRA